MSANKRSRRDDDNRIERLNRFIRDKPGNHKAIVMHWTGFDKVDGLTEHVAFENAVIKLNAALRPYRERVIREDNRFSIGAA